MLSLYVPILDYLSDLIEGVQERALRLIYPVTESCLEALQIANIARPKKSSDDICVKCMDKIESMDHPLHSLMTRTLINQPEQGAKKIIFTACYSGKLKLAFTSPDVISTSPKNFLFFCYSNSS